MDRLVLEADGMATRVGSALAMGGGESAGGGGGEGRDGGAGPAGEASPLRMSSAVEALPDYGKRRGGAEEAEGGAEGEGEAEGPASSGGSSPGPACGGARGRGWTGVTLAEMEEAANTLASSAGFEVPRATPSKLGGAEPRAADLRAAARAFVQRLLWFTQGYEEGGARACKPPAGPGAALAPSERELPGGMWQYAGPPVAFQSLCEHHMLPFHGGVQVVVAARERGGLGARAWGEVEAVVARFGYRLQIQERLTEEVADGVAGLPGVAGCVVVVDSAHMCMVARGVERFAASTMTLAARGAYERDAGLRAAALGYLAERSQAAALCQA